MTEHQVIETAPLVYGGVAIREKGEMLSLTDMWKAAGEPANRDPKFWFRQDAVQGFVEVLAASENVTVDHLFQKRQGRNGGTHAHWQIGIAYAKYLSHDFHMWCNKVVRERMEGSDHSKGVLAQIAAMEERTNGIVRMLASKITTMEQETLPAVVALMAEAAVEKRMADANLLTRRGVTAKDVWDRHNLPPKLKASTTWLGNRLQEMGAGASKADRANGTIRLFDPDLADKCMKNGLAHKAKVYASERMGQGRFALVDSNK